jgi:Ran GTPase-activating protein (RanGAP) involved in mRNA processing and transport
LGLIRNRSVKRLVLENLDIDRETLNIWSEMFRLNQNIKEIDIRRGFNTSAAMTIFASLKRNRKINLLKLQECTFGEAGFMLLQDLLRENQGLKKLEVKDLMRLRYNSETSNDMKNFLLIISGLTDNQSILEASVSIHSNHSCAPQSFTPQVSKALQDLGKLNRWLVSLKIEGFKLSGNDICGLLIGLKENSVMKTCVLTSNLVEWKDLSYILTLVEELEVLMVLDLQDNKILTYTDLENLKGKFVASQSLAFMKESLLLLLKGLKCEVRISSWLFDPMCYPAEIQPIVKKSKNVH